MNDNVYYKGNENKLIFSCHSQRKSIISTRYILEQCESYGFIDNITIYGSDVTLIIDKPIGFDLVVNIIDVSSLSINHRVDECVGKLHINIESSSVNTIDMQNISGDITLDIHKTSIKCLYLNSIPCRIYDSDIKFLKCDNSFTVIENLVVTIGIDVIIGVMCDYEWLFIKYSNVLMGYKEILKVGNGGWYSVEDNTYYSINLFQEIRNRRLIETNGTVLETPVIQYMLSYIL